MIKQLLLLGFFILTLVKASPISTSESALSANETDPVTNETLTGGPRPGIDCGFGPASATPIHAYGNMLKVFRMSSHTNRKDI